MNAIGKTLEVVAIDIKLQATFLEDLAAKVAAVAEQLDHPGIQPPWTDRIAEMPRNHAPFNKAFVRNFGAGGFWPIRTPDQVTGLTIHHTGSHSAIETGKYAVHTKGYPCHNYHFWVSANDGCPVDMVADPLWALWHDHTGARPTTLAIGLAGYWHHNPPSQQQITATAQLVNYLMSVYNVPVEQVQGHRERYYYKTHCPGWGPTDRNERSWGSDWKTNFYSTLNALPPIEW